MPSLSCLGINYSLEADVRHRRAEAVGNTTEHLGWARRVRGDVMIVRGRGRLDYDCIRVFDKVIHPDSRVDLGSSHHFMHNGEEIKLVSPKVDEK